MQLPTAAPTAAAKILRFTVEISPKERQSALALPRASAIILK